MSPEDYERYRRQLEDQLRADVELLYEAYRTKLRAYETVWRTRLEMGGPVDWQPAPPLAVSLPAPAARPALPGAAAAAPSAKRPPRAKANSLYNDLLDALPLLPDPFDSKDVARALGYKPRRSTLWRTLGYLVYEKHIEQVNVADGRIPARYRRIDSPSDGGG